MDYGEVGVALQYLESIALDLIRNYYDQDQKASDQDQELLYNVIDLSEKLKYSDTKPLDGESSWDKEWLNELRQIANNVSYSEYLIENGGDYLYFDEFLRRIITTRSPIRRRVTNNPRLRNLRCSIPIHRLRSSSSSSSVP